MRNILILFRKDFTLFFNDKIAFSLTFIVPVVLIYVFGAVFGVNKKDPGPKGIPLAVVDESDSPLAQRLLEALKAEKSFRVLTKRVLADGATHPLTAADVRAGVRVGRDYRFALLLPREFASDETLGVRLKLFSNPRNDIETQTVTGVLQKTIFSSVLQLFGQSLQARAKTYLGESRFETFNRGMANAVASALGGDREEIYASMRAGNFGLDAATKTADASSNGTADFLHQLVKLETEQVSGQAVKNPMATRSVGGWAMMFLMFALSGSATSLFDEKKAGLFQRLLAAPVRRSQILWSKFFFGVALGLIQLTVLFFAGRFMFGIDVTSNFGNLMLICLAAAAACTSFGMLLSALASTPAAAHGLATFLILTMSSIGGAWWPTTFMPEFIQHVSKLTLVYWAMEGFVQVLWAGDSLAQLLPTLGVLFGIAGLVLAVSVWRFNRGPIFD